MQTELSRQLISHRESCPDCTISVACIHYINIVREYTERRVMRDEVSSAPHTRLSVREA